MKFQIGQIIEGIVNGIQEYGVFVRLDERKEGLLHKSEIAKADPKRKYKIGESIRVMILDIDPFSDQISLSQRNLMKKIMSIRRRKRHFWTSRNANTGFLPLKQALPQEIETGIKKYKKYLA